MGLLDGKKGLILGLANDRSIAWGIAKTAHQEGAQVGLNYVDMQDKGFSTEEKVRELGASLDSPFIEKMDVGDDAQIDEFFAKAKEQMGSIDFLVHAIAFASKDTLSGRFIDAERADFLEAMNISCYSFIAVARRAAEIMNEGGSMLTMSYLGSVRVVPNYNIMGVAKAALESTTRYLAQDLGRDNIRVNAISAGPVLTLAASGIANFRFLFKKYAHTSALKRNITQDEIGGSAAYLLSDLSSGVSGEVHYVDAGFNIGMCDVQCMA